VVYLVCAYTKICGMGHGPGAGMTGGTLGAVGLTEGRAEHESVSKVMTGITSQSCMDIVGSGPRVACVDSVTSVAVRLVYVMTGITTGRYREVMRMTVGLYSLVVMTGCTVAAIRGEDIDGSAARRCGYRNDRTVGGVMTACTCVMDLVAVGAVYDTVRQDCNCCVMTLRTTNQKCNFIAVVNLGAVAMCAGPALIMTFVTGAAGSA